MKRGVRLIDFHSHVLPNIDDGSKSIAESVEMLVSNKRQGADIMIATPHFYINRRTAEVFLERREKSFNSLYEAIKQRADVPRIVLGAEVYYFSGMGGFEKLEELCINGTNYLLLEMPFDLWGKRVFRDVEEIIQRGIIPVIAHIERYIKIQKGTSNINKLINMDVLIQMNCEYINGFFSRGNALKLIKNNTVSLIGTDSHNMNSRKPNMGKSIEIIKKSLGEDTLNKIEKTAMAVLKNAVYSS